MHRAWINQPSKHQPLHHLHGTKVLAAPEKDNERGKPLMYRAYLLSGPVLSMRVPLTSLSMGWTSRD